MVMNCCLRVKWLQEVSFKPNDDILEINGEKLTIQNINQVLGATFDWKEGDDLEIKLNRAGEDLVIKTKITKPYTFGKILTTIENPTEQQSALQKAWLKG